MSAAIGWDEFETVEMPVEDARIFLRRAGAGPPVLLLHGFPQTHLMWRAVAPSLAARHTVVCADLPGYGGSSCPAAAADHAPHSKRTMARQMVAVMGELGFRRFSVAGHDRGGRVAYRLALDHPQRIARLAVLDVLPVADVWERADKRLMLGYWPWTLLAQDAPLPEQLLTAAPEAIVDAALSGWGTPAGTFDAQARAAYVASLRDPKRAQAICEEYRAAATIDHEHDAADRRAGRRIACPLLALWSGSGPLGTWYADAGGPLALWRGFADDVRGGPVEGGHFFPEEVPQRTAEELVRYFGEEISP